MPLSGVNKGNKPPVHHAEKVAAAKSDLLSVIAKYAIGSDDAICYHSVDFYSLLALAESVEALVAAGSPTIMLRMIGVMENAGAAVFGDVQTVIFAALQCLIDAGLTLKLAAETPKYAEYLAVNLDRTVAVTANIEIREQIPFPDQAYFNVICPGSARYDKGFLHLLEIFTSVRRRDLDLKIQFQTQILPDRDLKHQLSYLTKLYALPGVSILPSQISMEQITSMYERADLVLLPYAHDVYELRGSAVLIEAMCTGRQVLALEGPAFVDQIRFFGAGDACGSIDQMADKIIEYSRMSPQIRYSKAHQARGRFLKDLTASYRDWVI